MRILVAVASRHGATREIAEAIGRELERAGLEHEVREAGEVADLERYDAVVLGSALCYGRWREPARTLVPARAAAHAGKPVWLFSSGPPGSPSAVARAVRGPAGDFRLGGGGGLGPRDRLRARRPGPPHGGSVVRRARAQRRHRSPARRRRPG